MKFKVYRQLSLRYDLRECMALGIAPLNVYIWTHFHFVSYCNSGLVYVKGISLMLLYRDKQHLQSNTKVTLTINVLQWRLLATLH